MGIEEFIGKLASDKELLAKAQNINGVDDLIALGQQAGHDISKEDLKSVVADIAKGATAANAAIKKEADDDDSSDASHMITGLLTNLLKK